MYIVGYRGNRRLVVKVFLRNGNKEDKLYFKISCVVMEDIEFEFVNVEEIVEEVENLKEYEREVFVVDKVIRVQLNRIIEEYVEKIYVIYFSVVGM